MSLKRVDDNRFDRLAHAQALGVVDKAGGGAGLAHLLELVSVLPGVGPGAVGQGIANIVVGDPCTIVLIVSIAHLLDSTDSVGCRHISGWILEILCTTIDTTDIGSRDCKACLGRRSTAYAVRPGKPDLIRPSFGYGLIGV